MPTAIETSSELLLTTFVTECPTYTRNAYKDAFVSGETTLWDYWQWCAKQIEAAGLTVEAYIEIQENGGCEPAARVPGARSISDDDLCSDCKDCTRVDANQSTCAKNWPSTTDQDGYIVSCGSYVRFYDLSSMKHSASIQAP